VDPTISDKNVAEKFKPVQPEVIHNNYESRRGHCPQTRTKGGTLVSDLVVSYGTHFPYLHLQMYELGIAICMDDVQRA
jgi:hypothetical protein